MKKILESFNNQSLRVQLTVWFLIIALIPLAWITIVTYKFALNTLQKQAEKHLKALVVRQVKLLDIFLAEQERIATELAKESLPPLAEKSLEEALKKYGKDSQEYLQTYQQFAPLLANRARTMNFQKFIIADEDGTVVFSLGQDLFESGSDMLKPETESQKIFSELFKKTNIEKKPQISPFFFLSENSPPGIIISSPILDQNSQQVLGILFFQISNAAIYQPIQNFHGLGQTGETFVALILDSQPLLFLHAEQKIPQVYRINPDGPFGKFIQSTLDGNEAIQYVEDFNGDETIAIGQKINPQANWAIVTKVDNAEIIAAFASLKHFAWLLLAITAVFVSMIASYVARKISQPIEMLTKTTKMMTAGDLSQRIHIPYKNELGRLGTSFNEMASQLDHIIHHLDSLVAARTEEIVNKNSQLKQKIEELRETQNRLINQEKLASLGSLTAGIAHEIKNPLNFVTNFAELSSQLQKDLLSEVEAISSVIPVESKEEILQQLETLKLNLERIIKHGKRADSIVHNMLQHSRAAPGEKDSIDLNNLLDEYVDLAYHGMRAKDSSFNVKIEKNYDPNLIKAYVSPQEISRVFLNLLNNAFYAINQRLKNSEATYHPLVKISTENNAHDIIIKIWDNGIGIPKNVLPKLFTPFFTTKPPGEGTGLGLSLSYNIVVQGHNGTLSVESEEKQYTEFIIRLPKK